MFYITWRINEPNLYLLTLPQKSGIHLHQGLHFKPELCQLLGSDTSGLVLLEGGRHTGIYIYFIELTCMGGRGMKIWPPNLLCGAWWWKGGRKWRIAFHEGSVSYVDTHGVWHKWMREDHPIVPRAILASQGLASLGGHRCHRHEYTHERSSTIDRRDTFNEVGIKWRAEGKKNMAGYVLHR